MCKFNDAVRSNVLSQALIALLVMKHSSFDNSQRTAKLANIAPKYCVMDSIVLRLRCTVVHVEGGICVSRSDIQG